MTLAFIFGAVLVATPLPQFREHVIADDLKGAYQVLAVDLNRDGRRDLIALAIGMKELVWFENPGWQRHVIASNLSRMVNVAASDGDGDGIPELALASEFSMDASKSAGIVSLLRHKGDPREPWEITEIDRLPTSHRLRWADIDGTGQEFVINAPLTGSRATPPDYRDKVPLVLYRPGTWKRELISDALDGVVHGLTVVDWDGNGREDVLTASFEGIHLFRPHRDGHWKRTQLAQGSPETWPRSGSSEVAVGRLGNRRFLCAIEPWHGSQVAVYRERDGHWKRTVIDDTLVQGHALVTADLNGDGLDEIIAGFRGDKRGVYVYSAGDAEGGHWSRRALDETIAASSCDAADLNGNGRPDVACIGGSTLKWYENPGILE